MFSGVKTKYKTLGYDSTIDRYNSSSMLTATEVTTVMTWAQEAGMDTGFVTTARVTHATPAALYAHSYTRYYECDRDNEGEDEAPPLQNATRKDIAWQLIHDEPGSRAKVILGGGYNAFVPKEQRMPMRDNIFEADEAFECFREDGVNLIDVWKGRHPEDGSKFVTTAGELMSVEASETDYLFGMFSPDHVSYEDKRDPDLDPTLRNMTEKAIDILRKGDNGFFLMVEGARIDHAHHDTTANRAVRETVALDLAFEAAVEMMSDELHETLFIVTSDHSHTLSFAGYPARGTDIRGLTGDLLDDDLPYTTLSYANGKGYHLHNVLEEADGGEVRNVTRLNLTQIPDERIKSFDFIQVSVSGAKS